MRKVTPYVAPALVVALAVIFFMPAPDHDRPDIVFRPDPPQATTEPQSVPGSPEPERLLPPEKPATTPWEPRVQASERLAAALAEREAENNRIVYIQRGGKRFHKATCQFAKDAVKMKKIDAMAQDFTPCEICGG